MYGVNLLDRITILSEELRECAEQGGIPRKVLAQALGDAYLDGLRSYAWWHDGAEVLGSCRTSYKSVAETVHQEILEAKR